MQWKRAGALLALAAAFSMGSVERSYADTPILSRGGPIYVKFIGTEAALRSELWFFGATNPGPDQTPFDTYSGSFLWANQGSQTSAAPGSGGVPAMGSPSGNLNPGGIFAAGTVLNFGLFVQDLYKPGFENPNAPGSRGVWFYTGDAGSNFDGMVHVKVTQTGANTYQVGFEDLCRTSTDSTVDPLCANTRYGADWDFNDNMFEVTTTTTTPEPVSMALLGTGLFGLGAARRRKRNRA